MSEKKLAVMLLLGRIIITIVGLIPAIYYKEIIDLIASFSGGEKTAITFKIGSILVIILCIRLLAIVFYRVSDYCMIQLYLKLSKKIYLESFEYVHRHSYRFFANAFT